MAIRNDVSINWDTSPRVILVQAPSTDISVQDLYDTLRDAEVKQMDEPSIVQGSGKEILSSTEAVGLTITLLDALLGFAPRSGPTYEQCQASGGNLVAIMADGEYFNTPVYPTAFTQVIISKSSSATIVSGESSVTPADIDAIADAVWNKQLPE